MAAPAPKKRKLGVTAPEKIEFDFSAREEYLTGFHKRKVARIKHAQDENAKREKEEKLRFRREVRTTLHTPMFSLSFIVATKNAAKACANNAVNSYENSAKST
jgi:hypothetical protein